MEQMEVDIPDESNESSTGTKENGFHLYPVSPFDSGEGLPYAPVDWPKPGDKWTWRVGKRIAASGYFLDRYLYLPHRFQGLRKRKGFASKLSVEEYIRTAFPSVDVTAFFASFSWKIPSEKLNETKGELHLSLFMAFFSFISYEVQSFMCHFDHVFARVTIFKLISFELRSNEEELMIFVTPSGEMAEHSGSSSQNEIGRCKAGNKMCSSLEARDPPSDYMHCDICCSEPGFCRDCCCILCSKTIDPAQGGYGVIRCEANADEGCICGHMAHIECGLRCYMAGTVGGSIGLDAEYFCRRCDSRTDLVPPITKLLQTCQSVDSRDLIEKTLNTGVCILRGSRRTSAKKLLCHIQLAMEKLKSGTGFEDIWKVDDISDVTTGEVPCDENEATDKEEPLDSRTGSPQDIYGKFDHRIESFKLEDEIDQILLALRKSQESEYRIAEERLLAQKNHLLNLYQQLDKERSELASHTSFADPDALLDAVLNRVNQVKREIMKLREMEEVAKGFGKTSNAILKEHFSFESEH
ncbi:hypothetical protein RJ639_029027 [Escallonia herrerae]|uniref:Oberon PHD finger domain-containing protein n=1 Tax=Escallonia herrerae TaxID=1293975 RepID=A0AA88X609_9ASTE|nr:hypothetical protein RJ639_029027 [Escallonia herrerae]